MNKKKESDSPKTIGFFILHFYFSPLVYPLPSIQGGAGGGSLSYSPSFTPRWVGLTGWMVPSSLKYMRSMQTSRCTPGPLSRSM